MEIKRKAEDFKVLSRVAPKVEIDNIYMLSCNFSRDYDIGDYEYVHINLSSSGELFSVSEDGFQSKVALCLTANPKDDDEIDLLKIECEYMLNYLINANEEIPDDELKIFCRINAVYNAWPYWRELVDNIANRAQLPLPSIPLIKVKPIKSKKKKTTNKKETAGKQNINSEESP